MSDPQNPETFVYQPMAEGSVPGPEAAAARFTAQLDSENLSGGSMNTLEIPEENQVEWLIDRVIKVIPESVQMGTEPLSTVATVLAHLYQAEALRSIAAILWDIDDKLGKGVNFLPALPAEKSKKPVSDENPISRMSDLLDELAVGIDDALDPELSREEVIVKLKDLEAVIENAEWP